MNAASDRDPADVVATPGDAHTAPAPAPAPGTPRDRYREQVRDEVKAVALAQLAAGGPAALSVNAIAKQLGVSGPALYRYFKNRDELLAALVADAYDDLAAALRGATGLRAGAAAGAGAADPIGADAGERSGAGAADRSGAGAGDADRTRAAAHAYRDWAVAHPHRYGLLYQPPLAGFAAHAAELVTAAGQAMAVLLEILPEASAEAKTTGVDPTPGLEATPELADTPTLAAQLDGWAARHGYRAAPATAQRAIGLWALLHGHVGLELGGNYASMGLDGAALLDADLARWAAAAS